MIFSRENPDNLRSETEDCGIIMFVIFIFASLYIIGVFMTYGFMVAANPNYNLTTGCPIDNDCTTVKKMWCYERHYGMCFILGILTMWVFPFVSLIIYTIVYAFIICVFDCRQKFSKAYNTAIGIVTNQTDPCEISTGCDKISSSDNTSGVINLEH